MDFKSVLSRVSPKLGGNTKEPENYLGVKLSSSGVLATVWKVENGQVSIGEVGFGDIVTKNWDGLLKAADEAISHALHEANPEVHKVIYAVPFDWVSEGKIISDHLKDLRRLSKELDLVPMGYVVLTEALENFFKEVEGAPLTAILVGVDQERSMLTMYRAGKNLGTVPLGLEEFSPEAVVAGMEKALKRYNSADALPSRIIIYDGRSDLEAIAQKITAYPWTQKLPFLHFPKVEKIPAEFVVKAVAVAGGMQMGGTLKSGDLAEYQSEFKTAPRSASDSQDKFVDEQDEREMKAEKQEELTEVTAAEAGFTTETNFDELDIPYHESPAAPEANFSSLPQPISPAKVQETSHQFTSPKIDFAVILKNLLAKLPRFPQTPNSGRKLALPLIPLLGVLILVSGILLASLYFLPQVQIQIRVASKSFDHAIEAVIATAGKTPAGNQNVLAGDFLVVSEIGTKKAVTTGQKLVGNKAKGGVTIYSVSSGRTFPANTTITSPGGLKFTLDQEVQVASGDAIAPATVTVSVQAANIGDSYNLPANTRFTVGSTSSSEYLAKNDAAFTGGNSHQANVVTKTDQDRLMATLSAELADKAKSDLAAKVQPEQTLLPNAITSTVAKKKFSKDIDAEADTVSLDLTMDFQGVVFSKDEALTLFKNEFGNDIPQGYNLTSDNANLDVRSAKTDKTGSTLLNLELQANLVPQINPGQTIKEISGKSLKQATDLITHLPGVTQVNLSVTPRVFEPIIKLALPWRKENIKLNISSD